MTEPTSTAPARTRRAPEESWHAKLMKGTTYAVQFGPKIERFEKNKERPVTEDLKEYLEENAVNKVSVKEGDDTFTTEERPKFTFRFGLPLASDAAPPARSRREARD